MGTEIEPLKTMTELESLDLIECPISNLETYRDDVFAALPNLKFLNGIDREGNQEPDSDEDFDIEGDEEDVSDGDEEGLSEDAEGEEEEEEDEEEEASEGEE